MAIEPPIGTSLTRTACRALRQSPTVTDLSHRFAASRPSRLSVPRAFLTTPASGTTAHTRRTDQGAVAGTGPARLPEVMLVFLPSQLAHHNEPKRLSDSSQCRTGGLHGDKGGTPGRLPLSDSQASSAHARLPHLSAASPSTGRGRGGRRGEGRRLEGPVPSAAQSARLGRTPRTCGPRAGPPPALPAQAVGGTAHPAVRSSPFWRQRRLQRPATQDTGLGLVAGLVTEATGRRPDSAGSSVRGLQTTETEGLSQVTWPFWRSQGLFTGGCLCAGFCNASSDRSLQQSTDQR